jgi:hypothetical protein
VECSREAQQMRKMPMKGAKQLGAAGAKSQQPPQDWDACMAFGKARPQGGTQNRAAVAPLDTTPRNGHHRSGGALLVPQWNPPTEREPSILTFRMPLRPERSS